MTGFDEDDRERRAAHLDAVWAACISSPEYASALLTWHEVELTTLLELVLELDDQAPKP